MYDSYAKTVLRNACRDIKKSEKTRHKYEVIGTEKMQYLFESRQHTDIYPSEHILMLGDSYVCVITSEKLYKAMMQLPKNEKAVIILDFWYGWLDQQIAKYLKISIRTVIPLFCMLYMSKVKGCAEYAKCIGQTTSYT
jgi:DNA-directed RNA polymerase specialized sigma24 family protein